MPDLLRALVATPLGAVTLTLAVYGLAGRVYARLKWPLLSPILVTISVVIGVLRGLGLGYADYEAGGRLLTFFLGPAVVALGVPLAERWDEIRARGRAIGVAIGAGALVGVVSGSGVAALLGASRETVLSLVPRAATTPIALGVAEAVGGEPALAAAFVIGSGIMGAVVGPGMLRLCGVRSPLAVGLALGAAAHGIGTARAMEAGPAEGAASGLAIALCGLATALLAPLAALGLAWLGVG